MSRVGARKGVPWWKETHKAWFTTIGGKLLRLANGKENYSEACYRLELRKRQLGYRTAFDSVTGEVSLITAIKDYAAYLRSQNDNKGRWLEPIGSQLVSFLGGDDVYGLNPQKFHQWLATLNLKQNSKASLCSLFKTICNRLVEAGQIVVSPLKLLKSVRQTSSASRRLITLSQHVAVCQLVEPWVADCFRVLWETGTRPINLCRTRVEDVHLADKCIELQQHKTARRSGLTLTILLPTESLEIVKRLMSVPNKYNRVFVTSKSKPIQTQYLTHKFRAAADKLGLESGVTLYSYKHSRATALLRAGVSDAKTAAILGLVGTTTLHKHYSRLMQEKKTLLEALEENCRATGKEVPPGPPEPPDSTTTPAPGADKPDQPAS